MSTLLFVVALCIPSPDGGAQCFDAVQPFACREVYMEEFDEMALGCALYTPDLVSLIGQPQGDPVYGGAIFYDVTWGELVLRAEQGNAVRPSSGARECALIEDTLFCNQIVG